MTQNDHGLKVVITAGASGIGLETVKTFLSAGAQVAICDIDGKALDSIKVLNKKIYVEKCDVSDYEQTALFINNAALFMDGIDTLVNNAGIGGPTARIEEIDPDDWSSCLNVCLGGQFNTVRTAVQFLKLSRNPSIINLSSAAGRMGFALRTPYAAAKWGVIGFTKSLAIELGEYNIRVNAVLPGIVSGKRQENILREKAIKKGLSFEEIQQEALSYASIKSYVEEKDIANQILFLANETGKMISGQTISICGDLKMLS